MALLPWNVSDSDLLFFTKHLSVLVSSGIPLSESLSLLAEESKNPTLTAIIKTIGNDIINGHTLERGLQRYPKTFDSFYRNIIAIGEESGTLDKNLSYLATELEKSIDFKRKLQGVLLYPAIVLTLATVVAGGLALFVLPQLAELFSSLTIELPLPTRILLGISVFMQQYGILVFILLAAIAATIVALVANNKTRQLLDPFIIRLPLIGGLIEHIEMAKICRNIGIMLKSGLIITRAFEIARDTTDNAVYKDYLSSMYASVSAGRTLEAELRLPKYKFIPPTLPRMLGVGEHSGTLDESFLYMGDYYSEEVNEITKRIPEILEPALLIFIAGVVLFVALAIISPIYTFTASINP